MLERWTTGRHYHDTVHLLEVLERLDLLEHEDSAVESGSRALRLAAWYHDAVYNGSPGQDEEDSAALCEKEHPDPDGRRASALVRATAGHAFEHPDPLWPLLHDADLGILAAPVPRYRRYASAVRKEYPRLGEREFAEGRRAILEEFLSRDRLFLTDAAHDRWEDDARKNLSLEIATLRRDDRTSSSGGRAGSR